MWPQHLLAIAALTVGVAAAHSQSLAPDSLPATAAAQLAKSLEAARAHSRHVWRDTPPTNNDGTVNAYIEISRGDRRKWELDMRANARAIDRMIPESVGGYPVNYGFVPQTVSYDGDPFDALILGPPIEGGKTDSRRDRRLDVHGRREGPGLEGRALDAGPGRAAVARTDIGRSAADRGVFQTLQGARARARRLFKGAGLGDDC